MRKHRTILSTWVYSGVSSAWHIGDRGTAETTRRVAWWPQRESHIHVEGVQAWKPEGKAASGWDGMGEAYNPAMASWRRGEAVHVPDFAPEVGQKRFNVERLSGDAVKEFGG